MEKPLGVTIIELLIALAVGAVLIGLPIPVFNGYVERNRSTVAMNQMIAGLQSPVTQRSLCARPYRSVPAQTRSTAVTATWHLGALIFADPNRNGRRDPDEDVLRFLPSFDERAVGTGDRSATARISALRRQVSRNGRTAPYSIAPLNGDPTLARALIINPPGRVRRPPMATETASSTIQAVAP
jgi:type IV fimbrial biogenesis protein FimT